MSSLIQCPYCEDKVLPGVLQKHIGRKHKHLAPNTSARAPVLAASSAFGNVDESRGAVSERRLAAKRSAKPHNPTRNLRRKANREYKQRIYRLCRHAAGGDKVAQVELERELRSNRLAQWAVKHWRELKDSKARRLDMHGPSPIPSLARTKSSLVYGNAFRPYQGGAPGLGKKS